MIMKNNDNKSSIIKWLIFILIAVAVFTAVVIVFAKIRDVKADIERSEETSKKVEAKAESKPEVGVKLTPAPSKADEEAQNSDVKTEESEPEIVVLESLEGVSAGTVLNEDELDLTSLDKYFVSYEISDEIFERIYGDDRSYKTYCNVPREDLCYIKMLHRGFDEKIHVGEMIVNKAIESDVIEIFTELFRNDYQIEKMLLIDEYGADDFISIDNNNTSAFNYRLITGGDTVSLHAWGVAIDINPIQNPYIWSDGAGGWLWEDRDADLYLDRDAADAKERHMINHDDLCYQLFAAHGFTWGGDWENPIDYQHFEKQVVSY